METSRLTELETVQGLVRATGLAGGPGQTAVWCLGRLPGLYGEFCRDYDVRSAVEIRRLVGVVLDAVPKVARGPITDQLRAMHTRLGIPFLNFAAAKQPRKTAR